MLICYVIKSENKHVFQKNSYLRLPLRLGNDSFKDGFISEDKIKILSHALLSFKYIMIVHKEKIKNFRKYLRADKIKIIKEITNGL